MDRGTENTKVAALQYAFWEEDDDEYAGTNSIGFGTSPANIVGFQLFYESITFLSWCIMTAQRIEGFLRKYKSGWWRRYVYILVFGGYFDPYLEGAGAGGALQ